MVRQHSKVALKEIISARSGMRQAGCVCVPSVHCLHPCRAKPLTAEITVLVVDNTIGAGTSSSVNPVVFQRVLEELP